MAQHFPKSGEFSGASQAEKKLETSNDCKLLGRTVREEEFRKVQGP